MTRAALLLAALAALLSAPMTAHAQRLRVPGVGEVAVNPPTPPQRPPPPQAARAQPEAKPAEAATLPMTTLIASLSRSAPSGRFLNATPTTVGGKPAYVMRWTTEDGRRIDYTVDARTGGILSQKGD